MNFSFLLLCLNVGLLVKWAAGSTWCYNGCEHTPEHWGNLHGSSCGEKRQSPINIDTSLVKSDQNLHNFTFVNFNYENATKSIINTGHTVKVKLEENKVEISGGGLNGTYSTIQFHFHWGDTEHHDGSEHTIDGHRYPMEMHIVSLKKGYDVPQALADSEGIAVLGFFINATDDGGSPEAWEMLTSYLTNATDDVPLNHSISIDDLIGNVDRTKFYRYMGSLTTPNCNEAVVWTVFHEPITINRNLIQMFPMKTQYSNVYRPTQALNGRHVYASPATPLPPGHPWCYDDHCEYSPSKWSLLPHSFCGGQRQSPINIEKKKTVTDKYLDAFTFTKFDDKHAIKSITNTGHTVKCKLKEDVVKVTGGGLGYVYTTLQFHFHWGSESADGSEHMVDSHRYPMEMHIVNKRKDLSLDEAIKTPNGLAVLGFMIEAKSSSKSSGGSDHQETNPTSTPSSEFDAWKNLTYYLTAIQNMNSEVEFKDLISIDDLIGNVNRKAYYRYNGSLTTPSCNEAVVWTVFKESIKVEKSLIMKFPKMLGYHKVYRPVQDLHDRKIYSTKSASSAPHSILPFVLLASLFASFM
ncbi:uncharacterized protein V6R79_000846 [Siganus canaliculatus]